MKRIVSLVLLAGALGAAATGQASVTIEGAGLSSVVTTTLFPPPLVPIPATPPGQVLFQRSLVVDRSVNIFTTTDFNLSFVFGDSFLTPTNPVRLFDSLSISPATVGWTYVATPQNATGFADVAQRITDGLNDYVRLMFTEAASGRAEQRGWQERGFFTGVATPETPDLSGANVTAFMLKIDSFTLAPNASSGAAATASTGPPVDLVMTFTVMGTTVPEPETWGIAVSGLATALLAAYTGATRRRRNSS